MSHFQHPIKCASCSLHYIVCSDHENWGDTADTTDHPVCPECGSDALMRWAPRYAPEFIFEVVPGGGGRALKAIPL